MKINDTNSGDESSKGRVVNSNLLIIFSVTLMAVLGVASITPAFPTMSIQLGVPREMISLVIIVFTIPGIVLTPFLGVAADRYGRKRILIPSLFLFGFAGFACAFSQVIAFVLGISAFHILLFFRFFQGIGAASLSAINVTIIGDLYMGKPRTQVMGYNASVQSTALATYPALGGFLALFGWFFPFYLPLLAIPIGIITLLKLKNPEPKDGTSMSQYLNQVGILIRNKCVAGIFLVSTTFFIMLYGAIITYLPFLVTSAFLVDSFVAGLVISLISVASAIVSLLMGRLARSFSLKTILITSFPFFVIGLILIPLAPTLWHLLIPVIIYGIGAGLAMPSSQTLLVGLAPSENRAALMSLNGLVLRLGQTLGPLIMALVISVWGLFGVYWVAAIFGLTMIPVVFFTVPRREDN